MALGEGGGQDGPAAAGLGQDGPGEAEPGLLRLSVVVVYPAARRRGVASALLEALADAAYARGARRLSAWACGGDDASHALFTTCGLRATGRQHVLPSGQTATEYHGELDPPARSLVVRPGGLRLGQLLKLAGFADTGAEAKALLAAGAVAVNGQVEQRRGRQLAHGDVIVTGDQAVRVVAAQE